MGGCLAFSAEVPRPWRAKLLQSILLMLSKHCKKLKRSFLTPFPPLQYPQGNQLMAKFKKYSNKIGYGSFIYKSFEHHPCMKRTFKYFFFFSSE